MGASDDDGVQWINTAWINAMREELLRMGRELPELPRVIAIGVWIATFTEKDGSNAFPSRETLAILAGCSQETVTRAVKVLVGVGVLARKRRPNASAMYQLLLPGGRRLNWAAHIHHMTDTRQRKAYAKKKAAELAETVSALEAEQARKASMDAVRTATTASVPDRVHVGGSEISTEDPESVRGRPRKASVDAVRTATTDAPTKPTPTFGRDHHPDHLPAGPEPQPPMRVCEAAEVETTAALLRCRECSIPLIRPGRELCHGCELAIAKDERSHT